MNRWSILSITDIHYELPDANFTDDPKELEVPAFRDESFRDFHSLLDHGFDGEQFDLISIGGDITTHGKRGGIDRFRRDALPKLLQLVRNSGAIVVVPGNHDVVWGLDPAKPNSFQEKFDAFWQLIEASNITSCLFPAGSLAGNVNEELSFRRPQSGPIYVDHQRKLLVLCINSSIRCGELNTKVFRDCVQILDATLTSGDDEKKKLVSALNSGLTKHCFGTAYSGKFQTLRLRTSPTCLSSKNSNADREKEYCRRARILHEYSGMPIA